MESQLLDFSYTVNPTRIELELTERCNLACKFCYNSQSPVDSGKCFEIIDRLVAEHVPEIILTGGEPILHPYFTEIARYCQTLFNKVMVQTNGTLVTDAVAELLSGYGIYEVNVSLHGSNAKHDWLTQIAGSRALAFEAIKRLIALGIRVSSNFVVVRTNLNELSTNIENLYQLGVRHLTLTRFVPIGIGGINKDLAVSLKEMIDSIDIAVKQTRRFNGLSVVLANSIPRCAVPDELGDYCEHCHFGASRFYIDINGNVLMCGMSRLKIGNILEESFYDMKRRSVLYQNHILGADTPEICKGCSDFKQCRGGCRAAALAFSGDINGKDPYIMKMGGV